MTAKLAFAPDASGYSIDHPAQFVSVKLKGGLPRVRADVDGDTSLVTATWKLNYQDYMEFMHFFEVTLAMGSLPFLADITTNFFAPVQHKCTLVPGSFKTHNVRGISYHVSAQLEVQQNQYFFAAERFQDTDQVFFTGTPAPLTFPELFQISGKCQIVGAALNNGVNPRINLDGIYTILDIPTDSRLTFSSPEAVNPDWNLLSSYPGGITDLILNVALINVPT